MCLEVEEATKLKATLEALKAQLQSDGFASLTPNRTDDIGVRDEDFQPLNEMHQIIQSSKNRSTTKIFMIETAPTALRMSRSRRYARNVKNALNLGAWKFSPTRFTA